MLKKPKCLPLFTVFGALGFPVVSILRLITLLTNLGAGMKDNSKPIYEKCSVGTIYQLKAGGTFYLRYQIDGYRHCVSLRTANLDEARQRANELIPTLQASTIDAIEAQAKEIRQLATPASRHLPLSEAWKKYLEHPEHAAPATVGEMLTGIEHCDNH